MNLPPNLLLLLSALQNPAILTELEESSWGDLLDTARYSNLLPKLAAIMHKQGTFPEISKRAQEHLEDALIFSNHHQTIICFEVNSLVHALSDIGVPIILLKGAAFLMADLPPAAGRFMSDVDIMVPKEMIGIVEKTLLARGWERANLSSYDEHYFREWMHEIPLMRHSDRQILTDIHHTIVPLTSRYKPDSGALFSAAVSINGTSLSTLCPADMVLHSAAHLFNEEFTVALRDLTDLWELLEHFGETEEFWDELLHRSELHDMQRILYYLVRYVQRIFSTYIPERVNKKVDGYAPNLIVRWIMDRIVVSSLQPAVFGRSSPSRVFGLLLLHVHSHWVKMPPGLLARHLMTKALYRLSQRGRSGPIKDETVAN